MTPGFGPHGGKLTRLAVFLLAFLLTPLLTPAGMAVPISSIPSPPAIKVAYMGGLTGRESQASERSLMALRLLVDKYNKRGGLLGKPIQLLAVDNQSLVAGNFSAFQKAKAAGAVAIVGLHISNDALVVADLAERDHLPLVVASATHPDISKDRKYVVQACFTDDTQGEFVARFVRKILKLRRLAIVVDVSDSASMRVASAFLQNFEEGGGTIVENLEIRSNQQEFSTVVRAIQARQPLDGIFIAASSIESSYLIKQLFEHGIVLPLIGTDNWQNQDLAQALTNLDQKRIKAYFSAHWFLAANSPESREFVREFRRNYGVPINSFDADPVLTYDAGAILFRAISAAHSTEPDRIATALRRISITGATGKIQVGNSGHPDKRVLILRISNGRIEQVGKGQ